MISMRSTWNLMAIGAVSLLLFACGDDQAKQAEDAPTEEEVSVAENEAPAEQRVAAVDGARIINADSEPGSWMAHGRTYDEQRFSPLTQVNAANAGELGLAWFADLETNRGVEASPIVVDGVMYTTSTWSIVYALDPRTGEMLWTYDPEVPREWGVYACCDVVNRGVAVWQGKVFVGTIDGRLIALDAATGEVAWSVNTIDRTKPYTITGAPRVVKGKVIIGNGGAELGVRGYVTAYDVDNGEQAWRFYTVPGNPDEPFENDIMKMAALTWNGEWWKYGGGGTAWDSMAYDPELDLLYIGVGNGSPWNQQIRSPGGGDNLFLSSIVALRPETGEYVWHYQTTPGETWDYTATQHMILADLEIDGVVRKTLMQAPKNGFFYVIDRATGEFISAEAYVPLNWATHVDKQTGRPVEVEGARFKNEPFVQSPAPYGGHNWHPMSYNPQTGLVYIPALDMPFVYGHDANFEYTPGRWNVAIDWLAAALPSDAAGRKALKPLLKGHLSAWDPVAQKEAWRIQHEGPWNGGALSTAGNLLLQGTADGRFVVYRADNGDKLWEFKTQTGIVAPPITYEIDGEQYVTIMAGWGGAFALAAGYFVNPESLPNLSRVLTFKIGGKNQLPAVEAGEPPAFDPPVLEASAEQLTHGVNKYAQFCGVCHGDSSVGGGLIPDLRRSAFLSDTQAWNDVVLHGALADNGMAPFGDFMSEEDAEAVRAYVVDQAHLAMRGESGE